jgi:hypothetical protein
MIKSSDGKRVFVGSDAGEGIKATLSMKKDIEALTGEDSVEILF